MDKKTLRKLLIEQRKGIAIKDRRVNDLAAMENLICSPEYKKAEHIFVFVSFGDEIDTHSLIKKSLEIGKKIYIPVTEKGVSRMKLTKLTDFADLVTGHYGILTPRPEALEFIDHEVIELVIVPGLAFDKSGYRIGYGAGYYDKFFADLKADPIKLGYCYSSQLLANIPHDDYDVPVDRVITERLKTEEHIWKEH